MPKLKKEDQVLKQKNQQEDNLMRQLNKNQEEKKSVNELLDAVIAANMMVSKTLWNALPDTEQCKSAAQKVTDSVSDAWNAVTNAESLAAERVQLAFDRKKEKESVEDEEMKESTTQAPSSLKIK